MPGRGLTQMLLVEPRECGERRVTQEALIVLIPGPVERRGQLRRRNRRRGRLRAAQQAGEQEGRVADAVARSIGIEVVVVEAEVGLALERTTAVDAPRV